jgi:uncharacterized protein
LKGSATVSNGLAGRDIYDAIPVTEKSLFWIEGTERRFDGYNFFGVHPEIPIEWFGKHID